MSSNETNIIFRIDRDLKTEFEAIVAKTERTTSQYLRAFIKDTIAQHRRQAYSIAPESTNAARPVPDSHDKNKTQQKAKKGQKLNIIPNRGKTK